MVRLVRPILLAILSICLCQPQTADTANVRGRVVDSGGLAMPGVTITVRGTSGILRTATTDASGEFSAPGMPVTGSYEVTAEKQGFAPAKLSEVVLASGTTADIKLTMDVAEGKSLILVTGVSGEVRADQPQLGDRLDADQIQHTPILNRRVTYLPLLNAANRPAINQGDIFTNQYLFTTNGSGRRQAWFEVDGANDSDSWGRQTLFSSIPLLAVEETTILTNAFSAEYGAGTGAVVNLVTRRGTSRFHGDVMQIWRPEDTGAALTGYTPATVTSGNQITTDSLLQSSVALSGPLADRTQFFIAAEYSRQDRASPVTSPVAPGSYVGRYRGWLGLARMDHQFSDRHQAFFRGDLDAFSDTNPNGAVGGQNLPSTGRVFRRRTYSIAAGETAVHSPTLVNNLRVQFQLASPITQFDPIVYGTQYQVPISTGGTFTSGNSQSASLQNRQYQVNDVTSTIRGRHTLKLGGGFIYAHSGGDSKEFGGPIFMGQFVYNTCTQPLSFCESAEYLNNIANVRTYTQSYGSAFYTVNDVLWSAFIQDDFRVHPDLTLNLGLRYEQQTFTDSRLDFAPRTGFAYNLLGRATTVIRGGFGIYHSQIIDNSAANYALSGPESVFNYSAGPGQVGFPTTVASAPLPVFPAGAQAPVRNLYIRPGDSAYINQFLPTSTLNGYQKKLLNPYSEQWSFGVEQRLKPGWVLAVDYIGSHTIRINRALDVDTPAPFVRTAPGQTRTAQAANCTRPYWVWWYAQNGLTCNPGAPTNPQPAYAQVLSDRNVGYVYYQSLNVNLNHRFRRLTMLASYVWSHTIDNVDPDTPGGSPNDPNFAGRIENGNAVFDQRHRFVLSGTYAGPFHINFGGVATLASGLPFNYVTGANNSGNAGGTTDRPVIDGVVVGRNIGRGRPIYEASPFLERAFPLKHESVRLVLRAEAFNVFNHPNFVGYSGTYGNGAQPGPGFGQPLTGITNQLPARSMQFSAKLAF